MRFAIALNASSIIAHPSIGVFWHNVFGVIAESNPAHHFTFIIDGQQSFPPVKLENVSYQACTLSASAWIRKWQEAGALKKQVALCKADVLVVIDNPYIKSIDVTVVHLLSQPISETQQAEKKWIRFTGGSGLLINAGAFAKNIPVQTNAVKLVETISLGGLTALADPIEWTEKESIKTEYAAGLEYFVFAGDIGGSFDIMLLLKGFSQFKKWQHSNMQLLIAGASTKETASIKEKLGTFKYRNDVHILNSLSNDRLLKIMAGAYAFVWPGTGNAFPGWLATAIASGIPSIISDLQQSRQTAGENAIYFEPGNVEELAKALQVVYKDESKRNTLAASAGKPQPAHDSLLQLLVDSVRQKS